MGWLLFSRVAKCTAQSMVQLVELVSVVVLDPAGAGNVKDATKKISTERGGHGRRPHPVKRHFGRFDSGLPLNWEGEESKEDDQPLMQPVSKPISVVSRAPYISLPFVCCARSMCCK